MNFAEELFEHVLEIHGKAGGGSFEGRRKQPRDLLDCDSAGKLARHGAAHSIAYSENEIDIVRGGLSDFAKIAQFLRVKLEAKERVLIVRTDLPSVRQAEPLEVSRDCCVADPFSGSSKPGRIVENSKSIKQKRPSDWR